MAATPEDIRNRRTATKAAIRRAAMRARAALAALDDTARADLTRAYRAARVEIEASVRAAAAGGETVLLEALRALLAQLDGRITQLGAERDGLLGGYLTEAAALGVRPWQGAVTPDAMARVPESAVRVVRTMVADDGLQLSDRLWRVDQQARRLVGEAVQSHVIQGSSASRAAQYFLARGVAVPADVAAKMGMASTERVARVAGEALMTGEMNPYQQALRVFRTEINRAHGEAFEAAAFEHDEVIGTRFLLSPRHPEPDICDMHARANLYGLGPGVYPKGRNPWPAHPNTLSFTEPVFADEVSEGDRAGQVGDRIAWLRDEPPGVQQAVLASRAKAAALRAGLLRENEIATPWRVLKARYARRGVDVEALARGETT